MIVLMFLMLLPIVYGRFYSPSLLGGFDLEYFYYEYYQFIDFIVYFLIFGALVKSAFSEKFGDNANFLAVGLGVALSFALMLWESYNGYNFTNLLPVAIGLLILTVLIRIKGLFGGDGFSMLKMLAYLYVGAGVIVWVKYSYKIDAYFNGVVKLILLVFFVLSILEILNIFKRR